ncbi:sulfate reduction electron transfer complex DsrMKJOP subunit DsrO [Pseudothauera hydrothermalis]|uniref:sulfate reduction electron transfer complex DsrMKJOP subunit DsrO n=1 Tax=Pseudothauera hydrothermalis TaxID=2184083 RepID=UPI000C7E4284|nr:4Fe-4S dicluster domain-containing protein [Pseudothauera hydrothermalis]AUL98765.1 tetrathionate reductase subunit B [Rhodocyclaceae bacterium]
MKNLHPHEISDSRRNFLRGIPVLTAAAAVLPTPVLAAEVGHHWAMLVDVRKCIGCQACTVSCIQENAVPEGSFRTVVSTYSVKLSDAVQPAGTYVLPRLCNHCDEPPCIPVCPVGATKKRADGIVIVDGERCVGCAYCVQACPYDARFINHESNTADKCTFCAHRVDAGLLPACVETCVGGARIFGDLNDPDGELRRRLDAAKSEVKVLKPEHGTEPRVFYIGLDERFQGKVEGQGTLWRPRKAHA